MKIRIKEVDEDYILFDDGSMIEYGHDQECCERNYADFKQIDTICRRTVFDSDLKFEKSDYGFRFGNRPNKMFFVPCYSEQNGYYSTEVSIYYKDKKVLSAYGEEIDY